MDDKTDDYTDKNGLVTVRVPVHLLERIDAQAGKELISRSDLVRRTLNAVFGQVLA
jgi:metal-responsive CopG/Arc/MetJ family transcriptional regulator